MLKGRYFNRKQTLVEFLEEMKALAARFPALCLKREAPLVFGFTIGDDRSRPVYVFRGDTHQGIEWAGAYHALALAEYLARERETDPFLSRRLDDVCVKILPMGDFAGHYIARTANGRLGVSDPYIAAKGGRAGLTPEELRAIEALSPLEEDTAAYDIRFTGGWHGVIVSLQHGRESSGMYLIPCGVQPWGKPAVLGAGNIAEATRSPRERYLYWAGEGDARNFVRGALQGRYDPIAMEGPLLYSPSLFPRDRPDRMESLDLWCSFENHAPVNPPVPGVRTASGVADLMGYDRDAFDCFFSHRPYFLAVATDVECEQACAVLMPHCWSVGEGGHGASLFRWADGDAKSPLVAAWPAAVAGGAHWDRIDVGPPGTAPAAGAPFYVSPLTGLRHLRGASFGFAHGSSGYQRDAGLVADTNPSFSGWHPFADPDTHRSCCASWTCWFDTNGDGAVDACLRDAENDGPYERAVFYDVRSDRATLTDGGWTAVVSVGGAPQPRENASGWIEASSLDATSGVPRFKGPAWMRVMDVRPGPWPRWICTTATAGAAGAIS